MVPGVEVIVEDVGDRAPFPPPRHRPTRVLVAAVPVAAAFVFGVILTREHHDVRPSPASAAVAPVAPPATAPSAPPPRATSTPARAPAVGGGPADALDYTGVFTESGSLGSGELTYDFALVNESMTELRVAYPLRLVGPGDVDIPVMFAGILDQATAARHLNDAVLSAHRLARIPGGSAVSLLLRVHVDCHNPAITAMRAGAAPVIEIALAGVGDPAVFNFADLAGGFGDAVRQVCG